MFCIIILLFAEILEILLTLLHSQDIGIENESLFISPCFLLFQGNVSRLVQSFEWSSLFKTEGSEFPLPGTAGMVRVVAFPAHSLGSEYISLRLLKASSRQAHSEMYPRKCHLFY